MGTHLGPLGALPPTGNRFRVRMTAYFVFDDQENLVCERVYFDRLTMVRQLLAGLSLRDPRQWPRLVRTLRALLSMSADEPDPRLVDATPPDLG
jgi:hypothetical protein